MNENINEITIYPGEVYVFPRLNELNIKGEGWETEISRYDEKTNTVWIKHAWHKVEDKEPPKDGTRFLAKTQFCGTPDLMLLYWCEVIVKGKDKGHWACQCGCQNAEDCFIGDIIEWLEIPE